MKKSLLALAIAFGTALTAQNYELSTLRIGDFSIYQEKKAAEKIAKISLNPNAGNDNANKVNYHGEMVDIVMYDKYISEDKPTINSIYYLVSKSKKFKTKSGMGVGSKRTELIEAYKNYPNFTMHQYTDEANPSTSKESYFTLNDNDANTYLVFKMIDNTVVEVRVSVNEGC